MHMPGKTTCIEDPMKEMERMRPLVPQVPHIFKLEAAEIDWETCFNIADIVERNNEEDDDNLEYLEHADEETVESEYIFKPGYLQVIGGIFGDGSDDDVGDHDAETVRDADRSTTIDIGLPGFKKTQKEEINV
ncbi:hypothetical protein JTB14_009859 [Gonioctena quinquepunctata]|nr:hypothetical protein JTB14_009859 [Gonioctena quinquepunctata]